MAITLQDLELPDDEPMVIIRSSLLWICGGDKYAAASLNMYIHWTKWLLKHKPIAQQINAMERKQGKKASQDTSTILYRKQSKLIEDLLGFCTEKRLREANALLVSKGLLKIEDTPRSMADHVLKYELQGDVFKKCMAEWKEYRKEQGTPEEDGAVVVALEADSDGTDNLPLRDGELTVPQARANGKKTVPERSFYRDNIYNTKETIRDTSKEDNASPKEPDPLQPPPRKTPPIQPKIVLSSSGKHIVELYAKHKNRRVSMTEQTIIAANGLGEVVEQDNDFQLVLKEVDADDFINKRKVRVDLDFIWRKYDGFLDVVRRKQRSDPPTHENKPGSPTQSSGGLSMADIIAETQKRKVAAQ